MLKNYQIKMYKFKVTRIIQVLHSGGNACVNKYQYAS